MAIMLSGCKGNNMHIIGIEDRMKAGKKSKYVEANHKGQWERDSLAQIHQSRKNY